MGKFVVYEATNIKTGEKIVGTGVELSERFGVTRAYISKQWSEGGCMESLRLPEVSKIMLEQIKYRKVENEHE